MNAILPRPWRRRFPAAVALLCVALAAGCKSGRIGNDIGPEQERDMGAQYAAQIDSQAHLDMDGKLNRRIEDIAQPIFEQAQKDRPDVSFRIRVIDSPEINAFSLPGGYVYVYRGLLDKLGSDDDAVACVIAHESSHVVRRHVVKQMSDSQGKGLLLDLATLLTRSAAVSQIGGTALELDQLHFSRGDEYEADRWGEKFAYNAGYDPAGMVRTFELFQRMEKKEGQPPAYALDHPLSRNRELRALEQWRELRANGGKYLTEDYDPTGDQEAAKKNGIEYQALVMATTPRGPAPAPGPERPAPAAAGTAPAPRIEVGPEAEK